MNLAFNLSSRELHGVIFYPQCVAETPEKTVCLQNERRRQMLVYCDVGPTYPKLVINEFAIISYQEMRGPDNEQVIDCAPSELPEDYASRRN